MKRSLVRIANLNNEVEAQVLSSLLQEQQIDHMIQSYHDTAYDGIFQVQKGWGVILGYDDEKEAILKLLADLRRQVKCCEEDPEQYDPGESEDA